ncbi:MAG: phosphatidylserine decarboxylase family protein [Gemmatimonadales bacterium]
MIRIAAEGWRFIAPAWTILLILGFAQVWIGFALWLPIAVWTIVFFRDPDRPGPRGEDLILAPADGEVVSVIRMDEPVFLQDAATRISVFMNVLNVHVNRYPASGRLLYREYARGRFGHAMEEKASTLNEHCSIGIAAIRGKLLVRQIAGSLARRIVTDHTEGTEIRQGERLGMIRFGSRVDLFVPASASVLVQEGDRTKAGLTVVARWSA